jgi:hypothetical protein
VIGTPGSHSSTSSSTSATTPSATANLEPRVSIFIFHLSAFFGGLPVALLVLQFKAVLALVFLQ